MNKYISILFLTILILTCPPNYDLTTFASNYTGNFYIYTYQYKEIPHTKIIKNGQSNIIKCSTKNCLQIINNLDKSKINGMSFSVNGTKKDLQKMQEKLKLCVKYSENVENIVFMYGFSPLFRNFTIYNKEKINIQIAFKNNNISVGVPLILGSI